MPGTFVKLTVSSLSSSEDNDRDISLGVVYNALRLQVHKNEFEAWAKTECLEAWTNIERKGRFIALMGREQFKIQRIMKACGVLREQAPAAPEDDGGLYAPTCLWKRAWSVQCQLRVAYEERGRGRQPPVHNEERPYASTQPRPTAPGVSPLPFSVPLPGWSFALESRQTQHVHNTLRKSRAHLLPSG